MEKEDELVYAKVRFIDDGYRANIPIADIVEYKDNPPKHKQDCDVRSIYTCLYKNQKNPILSKYGIQIAGFIPENEVLEDKRMTFPYLDDSIKDIYYNRDSSEEEMEAKKNQDKMKKKKLAKKMKDKTLQDQKDILQKMQKMKEHHGLKLKGESNKEDINSNEHTISIEPKVKSIETKKEISKDQKKSTEKSYNMKNKKQTHKLSINSKSDIDDEKKIKTVQETEPKSKVGKECKDSNNENDEIEKTSRSDEQLNTVKLKNTEEKQEYFPSDDNDTTDENTSPISSEILKVQKIAETQNTEIYNLPDTVIESDKVAKLKKEIQTLTDNFTNLKAKYEQLKDKYNKQTEKVETLQLLNVKLQMQLYVPPTQKDSTPLSENAPPKNSPSQINSIETSTPKSRFSNKLHNIKVSPIKNKNNKEKVPKLNLSDEESNEESPQNMSYEPINSGNDTNEETEKSTKEKEEENKHKVEKSKRKRQTIWSSDSEEENTIKIKKVEIKAKNEDDEKLERIGLKKGEMAETSTSGKKFRQKFQNDQGTREELITRCVSEKDFVLTPNRTHKRKSISPLKSDAIERSLRYHCLKHNIKNEETINKQLAKKNKYFTEEINKHMKAAKSNLKKI